MIVSVNGVWALRFLFTSNSIFFDQTRVGDCLNSGKTNQDGLDEFYFVSVELHEVVPMISEIKLLLSVIVCFVR